jgi:hypothetical protein
MDPCDWKNKSKKLRPKATQINLFENINTFLETNSTKRQPIS